jgi:hypothetical protein
MSVADKSKELSNKKNTISIFDFILDDFKVIICLFYFVDKINCFALPWVDSNAAACS